jgi:hypothetical protein
MSDSIGRITVPTVTNSGQTFPLTTQYPFGFSVERPVIVHRFGSLDAKQEQRYYAGIGPRKFQFARPNLGWTELHELQDFWESMQGSWQAFTYTVPNPDGTTSSVLVTFEQTPISFAIPAQRLPGRIELRRGRRSDASAHLSGQLHLPAVSFERAFRGAAFRSPGDYPTHPHPRA